MEQPRGRTPLKAGTSPRPQYVLDHSLDRSRSPLSHTSLSRSQNSESDYELVVGLSATPFRGPGRFIHILDSENFKVPHPVCRKPLTPISSPNVAAKTLTLPSPSKDSPDVRSSSSSPARTVALVSSPQRSVSASAAPSPRGSATEHVMAVHSSPTDSALHLSSGREELSTPKRSVPAASRKRALLQKSPDEDSPKKSAEIPSTSSKRTEPAAVASTKGIGRGSPLKPVADAVTVPANRKTFQLSPNKDAVVILPNPGQVADQVVLPMTEDKSLKNVAQQGKKSPFKRVADALTSKPVKSNRLKATAEKLSRVKTAVKSPLVKTVPDKQSPAKKAATVNNGKPAVTQKTVNESVPILPTNSAEFQTMVAPLSCPSKADNKTRYLVKWVPKLKGNKLFVEGLLLDLSAENPFFSDKRWLSSQVKGVDSSGCQIFTAKTTYILEGKLYTEECDPLMPNFIKIQFKNGFPCNWQILREQWRLFAMTQEEVDRSSNASCTTIQSGHNATSNVSRASSKMTLVAQPMLPITSSNPVLANAGEQFQWKKPTKPVSKSAQDKTVQEIKDLSSTLPSEVTNASVMAATSDTDQNRTDVEMTCVSQDQSDAPNGDQNERKLSSQSVGDRRVNARALEVRRKKEARIKEKLAKEEERIRQAQARREKLKKEREILLSQLHAHEVETMEELETARVSKINQKKDTEFRETEKPKQKLSQEELRLQRNAKARQKRQAKKERATLIELEVKKSYEKHKNRDAAKLMKQPKTTSRKTQNKKTKTVPNKTKKQPFQKAKSQTETTLTNTEEEKSQLERLDSQTEKVNTHTEKTKPQIEEKIVAKKRGIYQTKRRPLTDEEKRKSLIRESIYKINKSAEDEKSSPKKCHPNIVAQELTKLEKMPKSRDEKRQKHSKNLPKSKKSPVEKPLTVEIKSRARGRPRKVSNIVVQTSNVKRLKMSTLGLNPNPKTAADYKKNSQVLGDLNKDHEDDMFQMQAKKPKESQKFGADLIRGDLFNSDSENECSVHSARTPIARYFERTTSETGTPSKKLEIEEQLSSENNKNEMESHRNQVFLNRKLKEVRKMPRKVLTKNLPVKADARETKKSSTNFAPGIEQLRGLELLHLSEDNDDRMSSYFSDHENSVEAYESLSQVPGGLLELFKAQKREQPQKVDPRDFYF